MVVPVKWHTRLYSRANVGPSTTHRIDRQTEENQRVKPNKYDINILRRSIPRDNNIIQSHKLKINLLKMKRNRTQSR